MKSRWTDYYRWVQPKRKTKRLNITDVVFAALLYVRKPIRYTFSKPILEKYEKRWPTRGRIACTLGENCKNFKIDILRHDLLKIGSCYFL